MKTALKIFKILLLAIVVFWLAGLLIFRFFGPPFTLTMLISGIEHRQLVRHQPVPLKRAGPFLARAVIASEDGRFCSHHGIDFNAVGDAMDDYETRGRLRGASTISMQVARNVFLWTGGGVARKVLEVPLALALDAWWPKQRILEVYLNIAEWGPGIFGAEAAAQAYFRKSASALSGEEAARLAAVLPNPIRWNAARPTDYIKRRTGVIRTRMLQLSRAQMACVN